VELRVVEVSATAQTAQALETTMEQEEECRRRAEDCVRLARLMPNHLDRRAILAAARRWTALAEEAAKAPAEDPDQDR
jgi:hypothetical protein